MIVYARDSNPTKTVMDHLMKKLHYIRGLDCQSGCKSIIHGLRPRAKRSTINSGKKTYYDVFIILNNIWLAAHFPLVLVYTLLF